MVDCPPIEVSGQIRPLQGNPTVSERARETMERQVNHMVHLVDDLLDVARISSGKIEIKKVIVDLNMIVKNAVETSLPLMQRNQHHFTMTLPESPTLLDADPVRLSQVLSNLLTNAAKYTSDGGTIVLSAETAGSEVAITITDSGIGIPFESLPLIFNMFAQVKRDSAHAQGGLGIGLSLVRKLVEMHGGTVSVASPGLEQGSTFCVRLPIATDVASRALFSTLGTTEAHIPGIKELRLLVVDDNTDAAETLAALLEIAGHGTQVASNGYQAIELATQFRPDVIFLDIGMPEMSGYDVAKALRNTPGLDHVFLIALTGWGAEKDRELTKEAGFDEHLTKPVSIVKVNAILAKLAEGNKTFDASKGFA
jgi:CheY-like chemotaxis protein